MKATALDAVALGFGTAVLTDAIRAVDLAAGDGQRALDEMAAAGVELVPGTWVPSRVHPGHAREPRCSSTSSTPRTSSSGPTSPLAHRSLGTGGRPLSGVSGLVEQLLYLLRDQGATHVGCATDRVIRSFRNDLYPGYKTEEGMPPELLAQFPIAERAIEALGLVLWPMVELEADDALATAADRWAEAPGVERVVICSVDKDLAQCVRDARVVLWDRRRDLTYDDAGVRAKWGVAPTSIPDYLALVGDSADGYPGIPGWGSKSAAAVLARWGSIDDIPAKASAWDVPGLRGAVALAAALAERRDEVRAVPDAGPAAPRRSPAPGLGRRARWEGADRAAWEALCDELGLDRLRARPHRWKATA